MATAAAVAVPRRRSRVGPSTFRWLLADGPLRGQAECLSPFTLPLVLLVANEQIPIEAELSELTPAEVP